MGQVNNAGDAFIVIYDIILIIVQSCTIINHVLLPDGGWLFTAHDEVAWQKDAKGNPAVSGQEGGPVCVRIHVVEKRPARVPGGTKKTKPGPSPAEAPAERRPNVLLRLALT